MSKAEERFRHYEKLVKKAGEKDQPPASCRKCPYYQPDFKYRSCLYARCPFEKRRSTLRDKPLKKDKFVKEVVKMGV